MLTSVGVREEVGLGIAVRVGMVLGTLVEVDVTAVAVVKGNEVVWGTAASGVGGSFAQPAKRTQPASTSHGKTPCQHLRRKYMHPIIAPKAHLVNSPGGTLLGLVPARMVACIHQSHQ